MNQFDGGYLETFVQPLQLRDGLCFPGCFADPHRNRLDAGEGDADASVGELQLVLEVEEVAAKLLLTDLAGM